jgi:hypothetical protein
MHHIIHAEGVRKCLSTSTSGLPVIRSEPFTGHKLTSEDLFDRGEPFGDNALIENYSWRNWRFPKRIRSPRGLFSDRE